MLTATEVKAAKQKDKPYKMTDGQGLYLQFTPGRPLVDPCGKDEDEASPHRAAIAPGGRSAAVPQPLTGRSKYVFPSPRTNQRPMSNNAILAALRRMGYDRDEMTGHGFRAMARTILDEVLHVRPEYIEHQLAHAVRDPNGRAYNRTAHLEERKKMMQLWSDYLDDIKAGAKILPFPKKAG